MLLIDVDSSYELDCRSLINLLQLSPQSSAFVCTSEKCVETGHRPTPPQHPVGVIFLKTVVLVWLP